MLLELFRSLADGFPALNVFNYLTLRAVLAALRLAVDGVEQRQPALFRF